MLQVSIGRDMAMALAEEIVLGASVMLLKAPFTVYLRQLITYLIFSGTSPAAGAADGSVGQTDVNWVRFTSGTGSCHSVSAATESVDLHVQIEVATAACPVHRGCCVELGVTRGHGSMPRPQRVLCRARVGGGDDSDAEIWHFDVPPTAYTNWPLHHRLCLTTEQLQSSTAKRVAASAAGSRRQPAVGGVKLRCKWHGVWLPLLRGRGDSLQWEAKAEVDKTVQVKSGQHLKMSAQLCDTSGLPLYSTTVRAVPLGKVIVRCAVGKYIFP
ncbi:hypothetical protein CYMTET_33387 [Cymbomonas tetramitiformis]|uniref:Uncharacterized protein n=1 Tax=Cymbomonas tetramitiformis TaxID=36881 RepID=A0AAE0KR07_9CHLO|nr:hypothetical protein CYMTET_33387 [Cymbomonas tetramitiformis]